MIEMNEIGQAMNARPDDRPPACEAGPHGLEHVGIGPDLGVTVHAGLCRRESGKVGCFDRGVAVSAIDTESCDVMLMTERHRLLALDSLIGCIGRPDDATYRPQHETNGEDRA